jgi:hypothetical protein
LSVGAKRAKSGGDVGREIERIEGAIDGSEVEVTGGLREWADKGGAGESSALFA